jgi:hypothetical protein
MSEMLLRSEVTLKSLSKTLLHPLPHLPQLEGIK